MNTHHCHLPEMIDVSECNKHLLQTKTSLSCHYNFSTQQKPATQTQKLSSQQFFLVTNICPKPKPKIVSSLPKKINPTLGSSYSRQPPSKTNTCRGVSFRSLASRISEESRGDGHEVGRGLVGCLVGSI